MTAYRRQPWLENASTDLAWILMPALLPVLFVFVFNDYFVTQEVSLWWWVVLVLCIDVSHVYSTLFRIYWDKETFVKYSRLLVIIPVAAIVVGFALHYYDAGLFWRVLAYIAVYHFIRQQYGFMRLYSRQENARPAWRMMDTIAIYNATIFPILFWHFKATDKLAWFVRGDFIPLKDSGMLEILFALYLAVIIAYVIKELYIFFKTRFWNIPKNLLVLGTYLSWYVGIVVFQADLIFTLLNVVAHGIPYMALIWLHGKRKSHRKFSFSWKGLGIFAVVLLTFAYIEEYFWDVFVWRDHTSLFPVFSASISESPFLLSILVAVLVVPQLTHYVLDGFIWRFRKDAQARI